MSATEELIAKVSEAKAAVEGFKKDSVTQAEFKEKIAAFAKRFDDLEETAKKAVTRIGTPGEPDHKGVAKLVQRGVKKMAFAANDDEGRFESLDALGTMFELNSRGQMTDQKRWDESEIRVLELAETVQLADALAGIECAQNGGESWAMKKMKGGERAVFMKRFPRIGKMWDDVHKAFLKTAGVMDTTATGQGIEWIPTGYASTLTDQVRLATPELNLFEHLTMPTTTWKIPIKVGVGSFLRKTENTNAVLSGPTTANITLVADLCAYYTSWSDEIAEDSIIAVLPMLRADAFRAISEGKSRAIISGDRTGIAGAHMDTDYEAAGPTFPEMMVYGLRHYALGGTDNKYDAGTLALLTSTIIATAAGLMGKYAAGRMGDLVCLVGTTSWLNLLLDTNMMTIDKMGPLATLLTGQVGSVFGIPIIMSHGVQTRNGATGAATGVTGATGINDAGANTSGTAVLVNRTVWKIGDRRTDQIEQDKDIVAGTNKLVVTNRWTFAPLYQPANYPATHNATLEPHTTVITDIAK